MSIKMIITDLDGTLLRSDKTISDYTKEVFAKCRSAGIKIVYATGRGLTAKRVAPAEMFDGRITLNGAVAKVKDEILYHRIMPRQFLHPFLAACELRGIKITMETGGAIYANFPDNYAMESCVNFRMVDFATHKTDAESVYSFDMSDEDFSFVTQLLPEEFHQFNTKVSAGFLMQIMHKDASKSKAAAALANHWDIHPSEIAAFGDDVNDIDLLTFAGFGVAMGNANEKVKAAANHICENNDSDGMARWLAGNIL
jgi:Cof subfamily protein (haloacid dehalogenase superfamily)